MLKRLEREIGLLLARRRAHYLLVSYPKCGRTWIRMMLGRAIKIHFSIEGVPDFKLHRMRHSDPRAPAIHVLHEGDPLRKRPEELRLNPSRYRDKGVILLVRDPRDVVVSAYFQRKFRDPLRGFEPYQGTLPDYLREPVGSIDTIIRYYNLWNEAVARAQTSLLTTRYEDVREDPAGELRRLLAFVGLPDLPQATIREAVEFASFKNMRRIEESEEVDSNVLRPAIKGDPRTYKTRAGKVGGFREHLTPAEIAWLDEKLRRELDPVFGYPPSATPSGDGWPSGAR